MANVKISQLSAASTPLAGTEIIEVVQGGASHKVALSEMPVSDPVAAAIAAGGGGGDVAGETVAATAKTTPVDADLLPLVDSAASNALKKLTLANLWTNLFKGKADALYSVLAHNHSGVYDPAGTASSAVSTHVGLADPHTQYVLESAIGTTVQGYDAGLQSIAGLTTAADRMIYTTASDTYAVATLTAAGRAILDDADAAAQRATLSVREQLTAARTYYVRTNGNDSNNGLADTAGGAFLTIQKAVDVVAGLDCGIYTATIQVADGTYNENVVLPVCVAAYRPQLLGNTSVPANCVITGVDSGSLVACISMASAAQWSIGGFKLTASTGTIRGIRVVGGGVMVIIHPIDFGATTRAHIVVGENSAVRFLSNWTISGSPSNTHIDAATGGQVVAAGLTCTLSGTPNFPTAFVTAKEVSLVTLQGITFSGSATGKRYDVVSNSVINTNGGGSTYLPGNASGTAATGGEYV
jgi:hypothetical protein